MKIIRILEVTDEVMNAFERLIPQLTTSSQPPTREDLERIVAAASNTVFAAQDDHAQGKIIGVLTLIVYSTPTGTHGWIEDVVVDQAYRGRGVGESLTQAAIQTAEKLKVRTIHLTSNPNRKAANCLYQKLGFKLHQTNLYCYEVARRS